MTTGATKAEETTPRPPRRLPALRHEAMLAVLLVGLLIVAGRLSPDFVAPSTQTELLTHVWETALLALPMTLILITGGIDLSVGSIMALSAVVFGLAFEQGAPPLLAAFLAILTGGAAGALNGVFVARVKVHPLLVTLATLAAYRGIAEGISLARPISGFPDSFTQLGKGVIGGINPAGLLFVLLAAAAWFYLARTTYGLFTYAIGHNETASRLSNIPTDRMKLWLYTLSGTVAALAAVLFVARRNTAKADVGASIELDVIAMVVLGGTSVFGGRGTIIGTILGVLLIHETREFVSWQYSRDELNFIVLGALLILSVLMQRVLAGRSGRRDS
jgi:rhamnose transport system permease protein